MLIDDFNHTIDYWIHELDKYSFSHLCAKPSPDTWSMGQVYMHLVENTEYYIEQIEICISNNNYSDHEASANGKAMLSKNDFPDELIEGPPENLQTPQPTSKEDVMSSLITLRNEMNELAPVIAASEFRGKTKHPGLDYFNAKEWMQFAEMHLRHHFRQKRRLDNFLKDRVMK